MRVFWALWEVSAGLPVLEVVEEVLEVPLDVPLPLPAPTTRVADSAADVLPLVCQDLQSLDEVMGNAEARSRRRDAGGPLLEVAPLVKVVDVGYESDGQWVLGDAS